jgi:hypothetical protein
MATYRAAPSNSSMESWYPLLAFFYADVWAQMMRQISRRAEDVGITCDWRNVLVNPGAPEQYPADNFLVSVTGAPPMKVAQVYLEQMVSTLETVCETQLLDDCKLWFFAPNEGSLVYCSGLDGVVPMNFGAPTLPGDRRGWKEIFTNMRTVIDALDRQKTIFPIPHPATLYTLQVSTEQTYSKYGYWSSPDTVAGIAQTEDMPELEDYPDSTYPTHGGYALDMEEDHAFPGWAALDEDAGFSDFRLGLKAIALRHYRIDEGFGDYSLLAVNSSSVGNWARCWQGCGQVDIVSTYSFSETDWADFVATYGEVVNDIEWGFTVTLDEGLGSAYVALSFVSGTPTFTIVGNTPAEVTYSVEASLTDGPFKIFANRISGTGWDRVGANVVVRDLVDGEWVDDSVPISDTDSKYADGSLGIYKAFTVDVEPSASEGTACDIV